MSEAAPLPDPRAGSPPLWAERYDMLDGWRGVAALGVVMHHVINVRIGHEAVMLFFVISGYCVTAAAEACRQKGLGFWQFMGRRVRRIYPPYLLSLVFFAMTRVLRYHVMHEGFHRPIHDYIQNLTLTQWLTLMYHPRPLAAMNPTNFIIVSWSLGYEEQFYLVVGACVLGLTLASRQHVFTVLLAAGLGWELAAPRVACGFFLEYWPQFALGAVVFNRLCRMTSPLLRRATDLSLLAGAVVFALLAHAQAGHPGILRRPVYLELAIVSAFSFLLIVARPLNDAFRRSLLGRGLMWLGLISYSLYLVHQFNVHLVLALATRIVPARLPAAFLSGAQLALHLSIAVVFWYLCERPFLNRSIVPPSGPPAPRDEVTGAAEAPALAT